MSVYRLVRMSWTAWLLVVLATMVVYVGSGGQHGAAERLLDVLLIVSLVGFLVPLGLTLALVEGAE